MEVSDKEGFQKKTSEMSDSFVLNMDGLHVADKDVTTNQRNTFQRTLSRKGSQRGERNAAERETDPSKGGLGVGVSTVEKSVVVSVANTAAASEPTNINTSCGGESKFGRFNSINYSSSLRRPFWLDPRRVLFIFATLSSMGTMILIYFTLSMGRINGDDLHSQ